MLISVIIAVVEKDKKYLPRCLKSLNESAKSAGVKLEFIIIANETKISKPDLSVYRLKIISNTNNIGFGQAINQGIKVVKGEWCIIANPDTITSKTCIKYLLKYTYKRNIAIIAPKVISEDGSIQKTILSPPTLINILYEQSYLFKIIPLLKRNLNLEKKREKTKEINISAAMWWMIRKKSYLKIGGFDKRFFLYFEDIDLCRRISKIIYVNSATVIHLRSQSNEGMMHADKYIRSLYAYLRKYYSYLYALVGITIVVIGSLIRLVFWGIKKIFVSYQLNKKLIAKKITYHKNIILTSIHLIS